MRGDKNAKTPHPFGYGAKLTAAHPSYQPFASFSLATIRIDRYESGIPFLAD